MERIQLSKITVNNNCVRYSFDVTEGLRRYFSTKPFVIEYPMDISDVPEAVLAVPFVCNVLPIVWLTDSQLVIKELDGAFYECLPNVKKGYEGMYPESRFAGQICVERIVQCDYEPEGCGAFFSGGLDATQTLVTHMEERPHLISIWGSDIRFDNEQGWNVVHDQIAETARDFELPDVVIHSSFREFDDESALHKQFHQQLKDSWWHGVKHGIALLGHAAPYAYVHKFKTLYIGSSHCPTDGVVRCASNPAIDNHVRFANCRVVHDGFEYSRQDKVHNVVDYVNRTGKQLTIHVCWQSQEGSNCCCCEKCYRTMAAILAENADPVKYGFNEVDKYLPNMRQYIIGGKALDRNLAISGWKHIHDRMIQNIETLSKRKEWKHIKWIVKADFLNHESIKMPIIYRVRRKLANYRFYQALHKLKERVK